MIWVAWRLNRTPLLTVAALVAACVAFLLVMRSDVLRFIAENHLSGCLQQGPGSETCAEAGKAFGEEYSDFTKYTQAAFATLPVIIGVFCGAPLFARELEQGTHVLALTQSVSRARWFAVKTAMILVPAILAMGALTAALWSFVSAQGNLGVLQQGLFEPFTFDTSGLIPAAYAVFAAVVGIVLGIVSRHTVTAMAGALGAFAVTRFVGESVRDTWLALLPTERIMTPLDDAGASASSGMTMAIGYLKADGSAVSPEAVQSCLETVSGGDGTPCFPKLGVTRMYADVLGSGQYWTAQLIEATFFVGVAAILLAVGIVLLRRRSL
jgi:hypothetical protein